MYFEGIITIDPSEVTKIIPVKPTKAFRKFLHSMTFGTVPVTRIKKASVEQIAQIPGISAGGALEILEWLNQK